MAYICTTGETWHSLDSAHCWEAKHWRLVTPDWLGPASKEYTIHHSIFLLLHQHLKSLNSPVAKMAYCQLVFHNSPLKPVPLSAWLLIASSFAAWQRFWVTWHTFNSHEKDMKTPRFNTYIFPFSFGSIPSMVTSKTSPQGASSSGVQATQSSQQAWSLQGNKRQLKALHSLLWLSFRGLFCIL